jgi:hypothetical protein
MPGASPVAATVQQRLWSCTSNDWTEVIERRLTQHAVAIPALGWRLHVGATPNLSLRIHVKAGHTADPLGQSPLPGGALSELHPAIAGLGLLLVNEVNQGGIARWSTHCHPDSDEDGTRWGNGSNPFGVIRIRVNSQLALQSLARRRVHSRLVFICPHLRLVHVHSWSFSARPQQDEQDPDSSPQPGLYLQERDMWVLGVLGIRTAQ